MLNHWDDKNALIFLRAALNSAFCELIKGRSALDTALDAIAAETFPVNRRYIYERLLDNIKQNQFAFIQEYQQAIHSAIHKWSASTRANKNDEIFFKRLSPQTMIEMERPGLFTREYITKKIQAVKDMLFLFPVQDHEFN